jgi:hypothetical protein
VGSAVPLGEIETLEILFLSFDEIGKYIKTPFFAVVVFFVFPF